MEISFSITWSNAVPGPHRITARARDNRVGIVTSTPVAVTIVNLQIRQVSVPLNYGVVFSPSGLNAPFRLELAASDHRTSIVGNSAGHIRLKEEP